MLLIFVTTLFLLVWTVQSTDWYRSSWCGHGLQYLDDSKCVKKFPTSFDRDWTCSVPVEENIPEGFVKDDLLSSISVDTSSLTKYISDSSVNVCAVVTKRVIDVSAPAGFSLYNRYFCLGDASAKTGYETWSSSKIFAMANAAGHLRSNETKCGAGDAHNELFGLDGTVSGKHGSTPLGDLATIVCSYDTTAGYSSNSLSSYFHDLGWRDRLNDMLHDWLKVSSAETLGGNYGEATPSDLGFTVTESDDSGLTSCAVDKDPWPTKHDNTVTALTEVELTRRLALHRELGESFRFPGATWTDIQRILYGAEKSVLFPGLQWGGMTSDTAIFLQSTDRMTSLLEDEASHQGEWRIFSKLGAGYSSSRYRGEIVSNAYTCLPRYDSAGKAVGGYEFTITVRGSVPNDSSLKQVELKVFNVFNQTVNFLVDSFSS